jgi:hypothetical protein
MRASISPRQTGTRTHKVRILNASILGFGLLAAVAALMLVSPAAGFATAPTPHWAVISEPAPTEFHAGDPSDFYEVVAVNDGAASTTGPITITDTLPEGVTVNAKGVNAAVVVNEVSTPIEESECESTTKAEVVTVTCTTSLVVTPGNTVTLNVNVQVPGEASGTLDNSALISGGGAQEAAATSATPIAAEGAPPVPFGAALITDMTSKSGLETQAGAHPYEFSTLLAFNSASIIEEKCNFGHTPTCAGLNTQPKDLEVALPPGLVGNPTAVPYCTQAEFEQPTFYGCPASTQVGGAYLSFYNGGTLTQYAPVYNIEPPPGQPGELGFSVSTVGHVGMFFHLRSDGDYGVTTTISNINQVDPVRLAVLSLWGNPSDSSHDAMRLSIYGQCGNGEGGCASGVPSPKPFLRMPTSCSAGSLSIPAFGDSWQKQAISPPFAELTKGQISGTEGCDLLRFEPSIMVATTTHQAGAPAGYEVDVHIAQNEELEGLATPDVRDTEVTLPEGTVLSPSAANGLVSCSDEQFGLKVRANGNCPSASKIGTVKVTTPLLGQPLTGNAYVGAPECSPCSPEQAQSGGMVRVFVEAEGSGVIVKQAGRTKIDQSTGQLTTVFTEMPQDPVDDIELSLEQGPSAPLVNPSSCGSAITTASLTPWSSLSATGVSSPPVPIEGCAPQGFAPSFIAGRTSSAKAGAFTGFAVSLSRRDGEQDLGSVSVTTPPGLLGVLKNVEQCPEAQATAGTCSAASAIGSASVTLGAGSTPLTIGGANVYLTGPYAGKPFGLSIVTPAHAGPFVLSGNTGSGTEVVRASIAIDPHTSALTIASDPLPQALDGVPLSIRAITVDVTREGFMFSPTNCNPMAVSGTVTSTNGTVASVGHPFQTVDCATLAFKPKFTASTQGKTSKKNGASLRVKVTSGHGQANIGKVKVTLPLQLPSRLATLQKACVDSVFEANPASCPAASVVGQATAVTPVLKSVLTGPAYLVSHAGRAFPDLQIVLQGEGITLVLTGNTDIKKGITTSTFKAIPDAPVTSFDLALPEGPHSVLAAFGNMCTSRLTMPTVITGQNGAVVKQTTKIAATGCPKHKPAKRGHTKKKG